MLMGNTIYIFRVFFTFVMIVFVTHEQMLAPFREIAILFWLQRLKTIIVITGNTILKLQRYIL